MKKIILAIFAIGMLAAGCKNDELGIPEDGRVNIKVNVPSPTGHIFGRALDNTGGLGNVSGHMLRYVFQVRLSESGELVYNQKKSVAVSASSVTFDGLTLLPDKYDFMIWADFVEDQNGENLYYNTDDLRAVTMLKTGADYLGDHTRDAFFASLPAQQVSSSYTLPAITLTRPFGRIEITATDFDPAASDKTPAEVLLGYTVAIPTGFNVKTGAVAAATDVKPIFSRELTLPSSAGDMEVVYDYIFAPTSGTTDVTYTVALRRADESVVSTRNMTAIPVYRNKRTILSGEFFSTVNGDFQGTISISDQFDNLPVSPNAGYKATGLATSGITAEGFTLSWDAEKEASAYSVEYALDAAFTSGYGKVDGTTAKTLDVTGLDAGETYYVRVVAIVPATQLAMRSDAVQATTTAAAAELSAKSYYEEPNVLQPIIETVWNNCPGAAQLVLIPDKGAVIRHTLSNAEIAAKKATLKDGGLQFNCNYSISIKNKAGATVKSISYATITPKITVLTPTLTLHTSLMAAERNDTVYLRNGDYKFGAVCNLTKNLVLIGENRHQVIVDAYRQVSSNGKTLDRVVFKNMTFWNSSTSSYMFQNVADATNGAYNLGLLMYDNCRVENKHSLLNIQARVSDTYASRIGSVVVNNVMFSGSNASTPIVYLAEAYHNTGSVSITNSTFSNFARAIVSYTNTSENSDLTLTDCTAYNLQYGQTALDYRNSFTDGSARMQVKNNIICYGGNAAANSRVVSMDIKGPFSSTMDDNWVVSKDATTTFLSSTPSEVVPYIKTLAPEIGETDIFTAPSIDLSVNSTSFKIKPNTADVPLTAGDPRWR